MSDTTTALVQSTTRMHASSASSSHTVALLMSKLGGYSLKTRSSRGPIERLRRLLLARLVPETRPVIRGVQVAADSLLECLLSRPEPYTYRVFAQGAPPLDYLRWLSALGSNGQPNSSLLVGTIDDLLKPAVLDEVSVWFEPAARYSLAFQFRDRFATHCYPVTCTVHGLSEHGLLHDQFLRVLLSETYSIDSFVCTTASCREALKNILGRMVEVLATRYNLCRPYRGRFDIIPLCVDTQMLSPGDKQIAKRSVAVPSTSVLVLYVGHLAAVKADLSPILLALTKELKRVIQYDLIVGVAGTSSRGFIEHLRSFSRAIGFPQERLRIFRDISDSQKVTLLRAADIFISPSDTIQECFGLTPVEAMSVGVPQVVAAWDGYRETVVDGETGFLIPTFWTSCDGHLSDTGILFGWPYDHVGLSQTVAMDLAKWCGAVFGLASNPGLRQRMGAASRARAEAMYSLENVRKRYHDLWVELAAQPKPALLLPHQRHQLERPSYFQCFKHFASELIQSHRVVGLGWNDDELTEIVLNNLHFAIKSTLVADPATLREIVSLIRRNGPLEVGELVRRMEGRRSPEILMCHIMWALKYGFLRLQTDVEN